MVLAPASSDDTGFNGFGHGISFGLCELAVRDRLVQLGLQGGGTFNLARGSDFFQCSGDLGFVYAQCFSERFRQGGILCRTVRLGSFRSFGGRRGGFVCLTERFKASVTLASSTPSLVANSAAICPPIASVPARLSPTI